MFKLKPQIKPHPRLSNGVVYEILRDNFAIECGVVVKNSVLESVEEAKRKIVSLFPQLTVEGIHVDVQLQDGN